MSRHNPQNVDRQAYQNGYTQGYHDSHTGKREYHRGPEKVTVWPTTGTVATGMSHPKHGYTQLYRRDVDSQQMGQIFDNPRVHTGQGYYTKDGRGPPKGAAQDDNYGGWTTEFGDTCFRCHQRGHWARDCPN